MGWNDHKDACDSVILLLSEMPRSVPKDDGLAGKVESGGVDLWSAGWPSARSWAAAGSLHIASQFSNASFDSCNSRLDS